MKGRRQDTEVLQCRWLAIARNADGERQLSGRVTTTNRGTIEKGLAIHYARLIQKFPERIQKGVGVSPPHKLPVYCLYVPYALCTGSEKERPFDHKEERSMIQSMSGMEKVPLAVNESDEDLLQDDEIEQVDPPPPDAAPPAAVLSRFRRLLALRILGEDGLTLTVHKRILQRSWQQQQQQQQWHPAADELQLPWQLQQT